MFQKRNCMLKFKTIAEINNRKMEGLTMNEVKYEMSCIFK